MGSTLGFLKICISKAEKSSLNMLKPTTEQNAKITTNIIQKITESGGITTHYLNCPAVNQKSLAKKQENMTQYDKQKKSSTCK